ncbi:MAG: Na(+)/H(+) antiporter subunit B [Campylobacterota bacterium]
MIIDILLGFGILWLAYKMITLSKLFNIVIYFIVFGMILALIWTRLGAYDLALAEVALGSGITGAILLDTVTFLKKQKSRK